LAQQHTVQSEDQQLFLSVADQLDGVMSYLAQLSQANLSVDQNDDWKLVHTLTNTVRYITSGYIASLRTPDHAVKPGPVALASLLHETAELLLPYSKQYAVPISVTVAPRLQPVMADTGLLRMALLNIGQVFVRSAAENDYPAGIKLAAYRSRYGIVAGVYSAHNDLLSAPRLRRALHLAGHGIQPCGPIGSGPVAGIFVAEALLRSLAARLHVARYQTLTGLATTLPSCSQLQLV
jgi:hypothetical protein